MKTFDENPDTEDLLLGRIFKELAGFEQETGLCPNVVLVSYAHWAELSRDPALGFEFETDGHVALKIRDARVVKADTQTSPQAVYARRSWALQ